MFRLRLDPCRTRTIPAFKNGDLIEIEINSPTMFRRKTDGLWDKTPIKDIVWIKDAVWLDLPNLNYREKASLAPDVLNAWIYQYERITPTKQTVMPNIRGTLVESEFLKILEGVKWKIVASKK